MSDEPPFVSGFAAGLFGRDPRECPHPKQTKEWNEWQRGHSIGVDYVLARQAGKLVLIKREGEA